MLLDGPNWQLVFFGSERFASWRSYVPNYAEPCPRALMEFDGEARQARTRALKLATGYGVAFVFDLDPAVQHVCFEGFGAWKWPRFAGLRG